MREYEVLRPSRSPPGRDTLNDMTTASAGAMAPATATTAGVSALVSCRGLVRQFGDRVAVDGVSFDIAPGETYGLLGPNSAGKTTAIRMVCGLLRPDSGSVTVAGRPFRRARDLIGYVPQEIALYSDLTARENLRFFGRLYRITGRTSYSSSSLSGTRYIAASSALAAQPARPASRAISVGSSSSRAPSSGATSRPARC